MVTLSRTFKYLLIGSLALHKSAASQEVRIDLPLDNIVNRQEFIIEKPVMNTRGNTHWRAGALEPMVKSTSMNQFYHSQTASVFLPSEVLHWRLASIGGRTPPFNGGGVWPGFKWFTTSYQTWFHPTILSTYPAGSVNFTFKIPTAQLISNRFLAGDYSMLVTQNYGPSSFYDVQFSPESFPVIISVPEGIVWLSENSSRFITIGSLAEYRNPAPETSLDLGLYEIAHTVPVQLWAKTEGRHYHFSSLKGWTQTRELPEIRLGSPTTSMSADALSPAWKNFSPGGLEVQNGNRSAVGLKLSMSTADFRTHFFRAGSYQIYLNFVAKNNTGNLSEHRNTNLTLNVPALSEITIQPQQSVISFEYRTAEAYRQAQRKSAPRQIRISNNDLYELYVKTDGAYLKRNGVLSDMASSILQLGLEGNSSPISLSPTPQKLIENGIPVLDKDLSPVYTISAENAATFLGKEKDTYSIDVIFSFIAL